MNCDMYPTSSPPASDYVDIFRSWGNESHAQLATLNDYPFTFGCNSTIATLDYGCGGNSMTVAELFRANDSHVSIDGFYPNDVCLNTSTPSRGFFRTISATGATPADYECMYSLAKMNDSHVYACDHVNATYNVNIKINSSTPPYSGCVDLNNASTFQGKVINNTDGYWFIGSASLCQNTYYKNDTGADGIIMMNATGITLNCNNSVIIGNGSGYGFVVSDYNSTLLSGCTAGNYSYGFLHSFTMTGRHRGFFNDISFSTAYGNDYGFSLRSPDGRYDHLVAYNNSDGIYLNAYNMYPSELEYLKLFNNTDGLHVFSSGRSVIRNVESANNSGHGIVFEQYLYYNLFENISSHDNAGSGIYYDGPTDGGQWSNITDARIFDNGGYGVYMTKTINPFTYRDVDIFNNSGTGYYARYNPGDMLDNVTIRENRGHGVFLDGGSSPTNDMRIYNSRIFENGGHGIIARDRSAGHAFENTSVYNNTGYGIYALGYNSSSTYSVYGVNITNVTVSNHTYNLYLNNTFDSVISNSTFEDSTYNVYMVNCTNLTFYYNSFLDSSSLHAYVDRSGNHFNTTNGSDCGPNCSRGNYWDDILTLDIIDLNGDGFGDMGADYPYNSANGGFVSTNVQDEGPITTKGCVDNDADGFYPYTASPACPGAYRDCDDNNASILPPYNDLSPTSDTILCNGTYYINDSGSAGVIRSGANGVSITCNDTTIIGNGAGIGFYLWNHDVNLIGCTAADYFWPFELRWADGTNLTNVTAYDGAAEGFYIYQSEDTVFDLVRADNNTQYGMEFRDSPNFTVSRAFLFNNGLGGMIGYEDSNSSTMIDSYAWNNSNYGFSFQGPNNTLSNLSAWYNNGGVQFYKSVENNLTRSRVWNNSGNGITFDSSTKNNVSYIWAFDNGNNNIYFSLGSYYNTVFNTTVERAGVTGIGFSNSASYNNVSNCTIRDSADYGVYILSGGTGNLFYYNSFINSGILHARAVSSGNLFNTTNGSDCGPNCSRGNYWDDILSLDIYDTNADGFGDGGTEYPYNAVNGGNVSANVQDEGPITTKGPPSPPGDSTMVIYGPNGTVITGTRSVHLNITLGAGAVQCRWANDDPSDLAGQPWEGCTTVKPWILGEGEGNKTVYMEVKDSGGSTTLTNDSILYRFIQDYTGPTAPVVYDGNTGIDIDWWDDNTTISAYWWNATDDISELYYRYRLLNDSDYYAGSPAWTDVGSDTDVTVTGLSLREGWNMSFEVMAYTSSGFNSSIASSNGSIIDLTKPLPPTINSTTHPLQTVTYGSGTVKFNFTATDPLSNGVASGVEGYSYLLDKHPGTAPDDNLESRYWERLESMVNDGTGQLLRANSSTPSPHSYAVYSQLHTNITENDSIRIRAALAEIGSDYDDEMRVKAFLISAADGAGVGAFTFDMEGSAISTISNVSRDVRYADGMAFATVYEFSVIANTTVTDDANDIYVVITGVPGDSDNRNNLSIAASTRDVDNTTNLFVCNNTPDCGDYTQGLDLAVEVKRQDSGDVWDVQYDDMMDGTYYFHAKAKDKAGNWGDTSHYKVMIDTAGVAVDIISPFSGQVFSNSSIEVEVEVNEDANVTVVAVYPDGSNDTSDWQVFAGTSTFNISLENGTNELYAVATNPENDVVTYSQRVYVRLGIELPDTNKTLMVVYPGAGVLEPHIRGVDEGSIIAGVATENDAATFGGESIFADTSTQTIKIFATTNSMPASKVEDDLDDDDFLDRVQPMFGYERGVPYYIIRAEVRPANIYLEGDQKLGAGKYTLVFRNLGETPEGKTNMSVRVV